MPGLAERLLIKIDAETGGAVREFRRVGTEADKMGKSTGAASSSVVGLGKAGSASGAALRAGVVTAAGAAAVALGAFAKQGIQAASALNEQVSASTTVFGKNAREIQEWSKTGATAFGQSQRAALEAANGFGTLFGTLGVGPDLTAKFSQAFVQLAGDLASFKDTSVEDATAALRSGLVGEAEPLRRYGVLLNETAVKNKALELGIRGSNGVLSEQEKVFVRTQLILEQTRQAQGNFGATSGELANQQRVLSAEVENLSAEMGQSLLPVAINVVGFFADSVRTLKEFGTEVLNLDQLINDINGPKGLNEGFDALKTDEQVEAYERLLKANLKAGQSFVEAQEAAKKEAAAIGQVTKEADKASTAAEAAGNAQALYASLLYKGNASSKELAAAQRGLASASAASAKEQKALAEAMKTPAQKAEEQVQKVTQLRGALLGVVDAQRGMADSQRGVRDASERVSDARARLNDLMKKGRVDAQEVTNAQYALRESSRSLTEAQDRLSEAQAKLNTLRAGGDPEDRDDAQRDLIGAELGVERARQRLAAAQKVLNEGVGPEEAVTANLDYQEALLGVAEAEDNLQGVQARLNEVTGQGAEGARALAELERNVTEAEYGLEAARRANTTAVENLNKAQKGDLDFTRQIRDAKRDLRGAEEGLDTARFNAQKSMITMADAQKAENELLRVGGAAAGILLSQLNALATTYPSLRPLLDDLIKKVATAQAGAAVRRGVAGLFGQGDGMGESRVGSGYQSIISAASNSGIPFAVSSTVRPGAVTSTGNPSLHAIGKAVDFGGTKANLTSLFRYFEGDPGVREMFYSPMGYGMVKGARRANSSLGGSIVKDHYDHVHVGVYHGGGVFQAPTPGGEGLALLKDKEVVLTPGQAAGLGGSTIQIIMPPGSDGEDVVRAIEDWERRNGRRFSNN